MQQSLPTLEDFAIKNSILNDYKRIIALRTIVSDLITPFTVFPGIVVHSLIEEFKYTIFFSCLKILLLLQIKVCHFEIHLRVG